MSALRVRRSLEAACAVVTCLLAAVVLFEPSLSDVPGSTAVWIVLSIVVPGFLAISVVVDAVAHLYRLGTGAFGNDDRLRPGDTAVSRTVASFVSVWLGGYVCYLVVVSLYVLVAPVGGVLVAPVFALLLGGVLGALVLLQTLLAGLFPDSPVSRMRAPALE